MTALTASHRQKVIERLRARAKLAAAYTQAAIEAGDQAALLLALRTVAEARGGHEHDRRQDRPKARKCFACALRIRQFTAVKPQRNIGSSGFADRGQGGLIPELPHATHRRAALAADFSVSKKRA